MIKALLESMRPRQWPKNGFVFIALLFDGIVSAERAINTLIAFALLCLMSGAVYLMNDLCDIESDRRHPTKKDRPLPSGRLNPAVASIIAPVLMLGSIGLGMLISVPFGLVLTGYLVVQIAYTYRLKHIVLIRCRSDFSRLYFANCSRRNRHHRA